MIRILPQESPITDEILSQINELRRLISLEEKSILKKGKEKLENIAIDTDNMLFLAMTDGRCCGYLTLSPSLHEIKPAHSVSELQFFVHPNYKRKDIGTHLVYSAIICAEDNSGISALTGWVKHINPGSKDLLEKADFKIVESTAPRDYWVLNRETHNKTLKRDKALRALPLS